MAWCNDKEYDLRYALEHNIGRVCTIYPTCGGRAGDGFTGVLSAVDEETCSLVMMDGHRRSSCGCRRDEDGFGRIQIIPLDKIGCLSANRF